MRLQLAINVDDLEKAIDYYSKLFRTAPNKVKAQYANFAIDEPPLKLVLFEKPGATDRLNHLGVETFDQADVDAAVEHFKQAGIAGKQEEGEICCYAKQNKIWSADPQGLRWEWYRVLEDTERYGSDEEAS